MRPKRRPLRPQQPVFSVFRRGGLHFGHNTTSNRDLTAPEGGLHDQHGGHRKTCWARLWNPWAAVPVGGSGAWPGFKTTRPATHSDTSAAGVEGAGGHGGPGCGAHGRGEAWPGFKTTRPATHSDTSAAGVEGAGGSGGHGRASRSTTPSRRLACGDLAGGRARRHPEHQRHHKQDHQPSSPPPTGTPSSPAPAHAPTHHPGATKPPGPIGAGRQWR